MEKVKIEIDMPNCCGECPMGHFNESSSWCGLLDYYDKRNIIDGYSSKGKPSWCPIMDKKNKEAKI